MAEIVIGVPGPWRERTELMEVLARQGTDCPEPDRGPACPHSLELAVESDSRQTLAVEGEMLTGRFRRS